MITVHIHTCRQMLIHINKINKSFLKSKEIDVKLGGGGAHLQSQHFRGRDRQNSVSSSPVWSTERVPEQPGPHKETLSQNTKRREEGEGGWDVRKGP